MCDRGCGCGDRDDDWMVGRDGGIAGSGLDDTA